MFLDNLLNKIPFFRNRRIAKIKKELEVIREDFVNGFFSDQYIISLHNIVNSSLIAFSDDLVSDSIKQIKTYTKTSVMAVKTLEKKPFSKSELEHSPLLYSSKQSGYFSDWYSNEESVELFVESLKSYLKVQVWLLEQPDYEHQEKIDEAISGVIDLEMYDSLLYRYLLEDLVSIISFYVETQYE